MLAVGHWSSAYCMYKEGTRPDDVLICLSAEVDNTMISVDNQWYSPPSRAEKYLMSDIRAYRHWYASGCKIISTHRACILFTSGLYDLITYWYVFRQKVINSDKLISSPNHIYANLDFSDIQYRFSKRDNWLWYGIVGTQPRTTSSICRLNISSCVSKDARHRCVV